MANLLDRASVVLTATAYNNNEALCVKPDDGSGDFDFSRNSAATRVNAQGLVENVQILSSNLVQNGDFSEEGVEQITNGSFDTDSDWGLGTNWSISGGSLNAAAATATAFQQNTDIVTNKTYKVTYTISNYVSGSVRIEIGSANVSVGITRSANGTYTEYITALGDDAVYFDGISAFTGSIENCSVREVGQDWVLDANWSIAENKAVSDGSVNGFIRTSTNVFESGKTYKVGMTVSDMTTGSVSYPYDGVGSTRVTTNGDFSQTYYADATNRCWIYGNNGFDGSITNISVKEITTDTNLPRINYEGFSYQDALGSELVTNGDFATDSDWSKGAAWTISGGTANFDDTATSGLSQNMTFVSGKTYKISFEVISGTASIGFYSSNGATAYIGYQVYAIGTHNVNFLHSTGANLGIFGNKFAGTAFSIDNVSVKEYLGQEVVPNSGCGHYLFEPASRNLISYSSNFSDAYWEKVTSGSGIAPIVTSNYAISPDGTQNADRIQFNATTSGSDSDRSRIRTTLTLVDGLDYTTSFYAKSTDGTDQKIGILFDNSKISVKTITSEWQRFEASRQQSGTSSICGLDLRGGDASTSDILVYGIQIEQQSYATSYIPTDGQANGVSRNQDVCTNGGSLATINSTSGVLYAEIAALANDGNFRMISISDGTNNNRVRVNYNATDNAIQSRVVVGGVIQAEINKFGFLDITDFIKVAISYKENEVKLYINGQLIGTDTSATMPLANTFNVLNFDGADGGFKFFGKTKCLAVFPYLTDSELTELTTI